MTGRRGRAYVRAAGGGIGVSRSVAFSTVAELVGEILELVHVEVLRYFVRGTGKRELPVSSSERLFATNSDAG